MSNTNKYNIQLNLRERLVVNKLTSSQEDSFLYLASLNHAEIKAELEEDDEGTTPMEYSEKILDWIKMYEEVRVNPNSLFDQPNIIHSAGVEYALFGIMEKYPHLTPEVTSIKEKMELVQRLESTLN